MRVSGKEEVEEVHHEPGNFSEEEQVKENGKEIQKIEIEKKELGKLLDMNAYVVDGDVIRDWIMVDFTTGGNPAVYDFVPEGEIWVENGMDIDDIAPCFVHEYVECWLMRHKGLSYDDAHELANVQERWLRGDLSKENIPNPKTIAEALDCAIQRIQWFLKNAQSEEAPKSKNASWREVLSYRTEIKKEEYLL